METYAKFIYIDPYPVQGYQSTYITSTATSVVTPNKVSLICPHCKKGRTVTGFVEAVDTLYSTCEDCMRRGHRALSGTCSVCNPPLPERKRHLLVD